MWDTSGAGRRLSTLVTLAAFAGSVPLFLAGPLEADWLVMKDGSRVETRAAWRVEGPTVVFEMPDGTLASIKADEVDLPASEQATLSADREATQPSTAETPETKQKAVFVLTDADVGHPKSENAAPDQQTAEPSSQPTSSAGEVSVPSWNTSDLPDGKGLRIVGQARNSTPSVATDLSVTVLAYDSTDELIESVPAALGARAVGPNQATSFSADLVGVFSYSRIEFDVDYVSLQVRTDAAQPTSTQRPEGS